MVFDVHFNPGEKGLWRVTEAVVKESRSPPPTLPPVPSSKKQAEFGNEVLTEQINVKDCDG